MKKSVVFLLLILISIFSVLLLYHTRSAQSVTIMKDVGEAYMDHFGLTDQDFKLLKASGVQVIEGNFDICADESDVSYFLNQSLKYDMRVIMPAGSGEAEWGYACDQETSSSYPINQKPVWNRKAVVRWINTWKNHKAVYAWDSSNEAGSVFPNASDATMVTEAQLQTAYRDIRSADPSHPVMIRMNGWYFYDNEDDFFRQGNPFGKSVADIIMVNAYSNVSDYYPDFVTTVMTRASASLREIDPHVKIIVSLGVWEEKPLWVKPSKEQFMNDIILLNDLKDISGIAYFKYGAKGSEWYLPDEKNGAPELLTVISRTRL